MANKIDAARKRLTKAIKKHAEIVSGTAVPLKKAQRAAAAIQQAALDYAELKAERDALASKPKAKK
jgi:hypothetical protein